MKTTYNKFLIISTLFLFLGGIYLYFSNDLKNNGLILVASGSSLSSSTGDPVTTASVNKGGNISEDISFLTTLVSLKNIKIDTSFFNDYSFKILKNNAVTISPVSPGRVNPFDPIGFAGQINSTNSKQGVITDLPSQITATSVVLNGTVKIVNESADTYFEYGQNQSNPTTISAKQSLVGTFIKSITGLTPKTTYSFRACAKINNVALCGDNVSFTTN